MSYAAFAKLIEEGVVSALNADTTLITTLGTALVEQEPQQREDDAPELWESKLPYVGVTCTSGGSKYLGTRCHGLQYKVRLRCLHRESPTVDAREQLLSIRDRAAHVVVLKNGANNLMTGQTYHTLIDGYTAEAPSVTEFDQFLLEAIATVDVTVVFPED